ncbi:MAG: hypothetical protein MJ236_07430, partial [Clostridia bacterium]|nr:hypothetical protein [Clostridia bacterium]
VLNSINGQMDLSKLTELQQGAAQLAAGAQTLDAGVATAQGGANTLASNSGALTSGSSRLLEGSNTLLTGVNALDAGAGELHDGMVQFNEEGIERLTSSLDGNATKAIDRIEAVIEAGNNYQSFTKLADGKEGKVKFVIRTGAVK